MTSRLERACPIDSNLCGNPPVRGYRRDRACAHPSANMGCVGRTETSPVPTHRFQLNVLEKVGLPLPAKWGYAQTQRATPKRSCGGKPRPYEMKVLLN